MRINASARVGVYRLLFTFLDFILVSAARFSRAGARANARARSFREGRGVEACLLAYA